MIQLEWYSVLYVYRVGYAGYPHDNLTTDELQNQCPQSS